MKVYVDKKEWEKICSFAGRKIEYNPLFKLFNDAEDIADYTKQVRKELIAKVYEILEQAVPHDLSWSWAVIKKELDQIQGETK